MLLPFLQFLSIAEHLYTYYLIEKWNIFHLCYIRNPNKKINCDDNQIVFSTCKKFIYIATKWVLGELNFDLSTFINGLLSPIENCGALQSRFTMSVQ